MVRKFLALVVSLCVWASAFAQSEADSMVNIMDGISVPLVNKDYVAPTHFRDNWYIGLYGGANNTFGSDGAQVPFAKKTRFAAAIAVGKEITPVSDLRMQIAYTRNVGVTDDQFPKKALELGWEGDHSHLNHQPFCFNTWALNFDYMPNFTNMLLGFREDRWFYLRGLLGIGGCMSSGYETDPYSKYYNNEHGQQLVNMDKYDNRRHSLVNIRTGLSGLFLLSRNWNLHVETIVNFADNSFDSNPQTDNTWDGHFDLLVGLSYHFHGKGGKRAGFYYARNDLEFYKRRARAIEDLRDRTKQRLDELKEMAPDTIDVDAHVIYTLIAFDEGSTIVDRLQQSNIYTTAYAWSKARNCDIYITNSTAVDDELFLHRAQAICDVLMERYEIPAQKILYMPDEKKIRKRGDYIVFIVND